MAAEAVLEAGGTFDAVLHQGLAAIIPFLNEEGQRSAQYRAHRPDT